MAPLVLLTAALSLVVWTGGWYLEEMSDVADVLGGWGRFSIAWGVWLAVAAVFLYRTVTYTYRLTDRSLLLDFGPLFPPVAAVPLAEVTAVVIGSAWLARRFGVGWVEVRTRDRAFRLRGIRHPGRFAEKLRVAVAAARAV
jgi:hypothetical protein